MGMLDRIKKKQFDGFKEFVESVESAGPVQRPAILLNGILDDPRFMRWVTRNVRGFKDFLALPSDELEQVVKSGEALVSVLAKALEATTAEELQAYAGSFPRHFSQLRDEWGFLQAVSPAERESARGFLLKTVRRLQRQELIQGFHWELPPPELFHPPPVPRDGLGRIQFEDGTLAAEGELLKGKRIGTWKHYYDDGKLLGEGAYLEGMKNGEWSFFFGSGAPRARGKYRQDLRHGMWSEWDREGTERQAEWVEGKRKDPG